MDWLKTLFNRIQQSRVEVAPPRRGPITSVRPAKEAASQPPLDALVIDTKELHPYWRHFRMINPTGGWPEFTRYLQKSKLDLAREIRTLEATLRDISSRSKFRP